LKNNIKLDLKDVAWEMDGTLLGSSFLAGLAGFCPSSDDPSRSSKKEFFDKYPT
jgi:hypothetical protein